MGIKYPFGSTPIYPPRDWTCVVCKKYHSRPHFAFPGQIDYSKQPTEEGRVKFNREGSQMSCDDPKKYDTPIKVMKETTGDQFTKDDNHRPLFCPHCGWEDTIICIMKTQPKKRKKYGIL